MRKAADASVGFPLSGFGGDNHEPGSSEVSLLDPRSSLPSRGLGASGSGAWGSTLRGVAAVESVAAEETGVPNTNLIGFTGAAAVASVGGIPTLNSCSANSSVAWGAALRRDRQTLSLGGSDERALPLGDRFKANGAEGGARVAVGGLRAEVFRGTTDRWAGFVEVGSGVGDKGEKTFILGTGSAIRSPAIFVGVCTSVWESGSSSSSSGSMVVRRDDSSTSCNGPPRRGVRGVAQLVVDCTRWLRGKVGIGVFVGVGSSTGFPVRRGVVRPGSRFARSGVDTVGLSCEEANDVCEARRVDVSLDTLRCREAAVGALRVDVPLNRLLPDGVLDLVRDDVVGLTEDPRTAPCRWS